MTRKSFLNAIAVDMAIGGSTNTLLHLMAAAKTAGVELTLEDFDKVSKKGAQPVPHQPLGASTASWTCTGPAASPP